MTADRTRQAPALKKRLRMRIGYVREAGRHMEWSEWQVVRGRKIVARFDLEEQADDFIREAEKADDR